MPSLSSWVVLGALLLCGCIVGSYAQTLPAYAQHELYRHDKICYAGSATTNGLAYEDATKEHSEIEGEESLAGVTLGTDFEWSLREECVSGEVRDPMTNLVTGGLPIRDQNNCGACWAYAHADFITLWYCQRQITDDLRNPVNLASLQQHVDCVPSKREGGARNAGCGMGSMKLASLYYMGRLTATDIKGSGATSGFASEADYPLTYVRGGGLDRVIVRDAVHNHGQCMYQPNSPFPWGRVPPSPTAPQLLIDIGPLSQKEMTYLFQQGRAPFATSMYVAESHMIIRKCEESESSGVSVYDNIDECPRTARANHAVVAIGMGTTPSGPGDQGQTPYFYIRNSWSHWWGDNGHIRLIRDSTNPHVPGSDTSIPGGEAMCSLGFMNSYPRADGAAADDSCTRFSFA